MRLRHILLANLLALSLPLSAATEVIPLNYRTAEDVLPIVQSTLGGQGRVNAYGNQLIINADPAMMSEIRNLLTQLDTEPKRLLITVDTSESGFGNNQGFRADGSISSGNGQIQIGQGEVHGRDQVRIINRSTTSRSGGTQQIQATEGYPALIQVGQSVPLTTYGHDGYGQTYRNTQYRDVTRGMYVTASVSGEMVHLNISTNNDRMSQSQPGVVNVQGTDTRVSGRLGEWINLGGVSEQSNGTNTGIVRYQSTQGRNDMSLRVKVDLLQ
ncbi:secretin N-terminal domain-containing protein [Ectopseudomonas mendocina]|uniref:Secretin N-terminal domain-containing protein n=1 Tax=Ectopseudomonas mendocina TaxID=300 RepID=A0ABZ2RR38_ECTME